ncbi:hypothetical protein GOP47_0014021 [Adiantum capillus-veneris]|uniref:Exostosin GT47 domain-containing protein n=1 Tax=Adiantum capillus-veneris TaxID=13818 RepID=A0A9D4ZFY6_ADICA|nr:hypothetical protein GOP47_0014021 [Adiantum capillus-veneris]
MTYSIDNIGTKALIPTKGTVRLRLLLALLCIVGLLLIAFYSEIAQVLRFSLLQSTIICSSITTDQSLAHQDNVSVAACTCSNTSTDLLTLSSPSTQPDDEAAKQWFANKFWHMENTFPLCSMDSCFNFSRCANMANFRIYAYGPPYYEPLSYLAALNSTPWLTTNASEACLFLVTMPTHHVRPCPPHPSTLPHWNGGLNHVIATLADRWSITAPPPHTIGNASVLASCLYETTHRPGFDISIPLAGKTHLTHLQSLKPWDRKYFLTFRGTRYLGHKEGNFRSNPAMRAMHNGKDVVVAVTCNQVTNNEIREQNPDAGKGCDEDESRFKRYGFRELMNSTFGLVPAGRSPSSYRLIETMSTGSIPVLISDNYVKPFEGLIQWHQCALQFPTSEIARILPALRAVSREEMKRRQRYCLFIYEEYLKDDVALVSAVVKSLKLRFYGMLPQFNEALPIPLSGSSKEMKVSRF